MRDYKRNIILAMGIFAGLSISTIVYVLFFYTPHPVVVQSPVPVEIDGDTLILTSVYTRVVQVPVVIYTQYERDDGLIIETSPRESSGGQIGEGLVANIPVPIPPSLPDGTYIRRSRGVYDLLGNGLVIRFAEWHTEPFTIERK